LQNKNIEKAFWRTQILTSRVACGRWQWSN